MNQKYEDNLKRIRAAYESDDRQNLGARLMGVKRILEESGFGGDTRCIEDAADCLAAMTEERSVAVLTGLYHAVAEQQYTLASMGWNAPSDPNGWTKAGARAHQYADVEAAMNEALSVIEPLEPQGRAALLLRLVRIKNKSARIFKLASHTQPCGCWHCDIARDIAGDKNVLPDPRAVDAAEKP